MDRRGYAAAVEDEYRLRAALETARAEKARATSAAIRRRANDAAPIARIDELYTRTPAQERYVAVIAESLAANAALTAEERERTLNAVKSTLYAVCVAATIASVGDPAPLPDEPAGVVRDYLERTLPGKLE